MPTESTINNDFFKFIDSPLKAYILGLVVFNRKDNDDIDNIYVEIKLNNVKEHDNNMKCISYGYYNDLKEAEKIHYPYFNNIDMLLRYLNNVGNAKYTELSCINGIIELTILSYMFPYPIVVFDNFNNIKYIFSNGKVSVNDKTSKKYTHSSEHNKTIYIKFEYEGSNNIPSNVSSIYYI